MSSPNLDSPLPGVAARSQPGPVLFGRYVLLDQVQQGASAAVHRALDREARDSGVIIIKRILPHMASDRPFLEAFAIEAKRAGQLQHPNICPVHELGRVGESLYMAMEWVPGRDLAHALRMLHASNRQLPSGLAAWIAAQLCDALEAAHQLRSPFGPIGLVHRDLSPANVLLSREGHVKLIDFGMAKALGQAQHTNLQALKRKLAYTSPEIVSGYALDGRSDVFGVGILLYEMICQQSPFRGSSDIEKLTQIAQANVVPLEEACSQPVPQALQAIILRALQRKPADRYSSAAEMSGELRQYLTQSEARAGAGELQQLMMELYADAFSAEDQHLSNLIQTACRLFRPGTPAEQTQPPPSAATPWLPSDIPHELGAGTQILFRLDALTPPSLPAKVPATASQQAQQAPAPREPSSPQSPGSALSRPHTAVPGSAEADSPPPSSTPGHATPSSRTTVPPIEPLQANRPTEDRDPWAVRMLAAGLLLLLLAILLLSRGAPGPLHWPWASSNLASLQVHTVPEHEAQVYLDDTLRGLAPLQLHNVRVGPHSLRIVADGFHEVRRNIDLTESGSFMVLEIDLVPELP